METNTALRIFVVDDDRFSLTVYTQHLHNLGYDDVTAFNNGSDCIRHLSGEPDVVFLDHHMESMTGVEVLKQIKEYNPDIYVVFISGQEDVQTALNSLKYGAFDYIVKNAADTRKIEQVLMKIQEVKALLVMNRGNAVF